MRGDPSESCIFTTAFAPEWPEAVEPNTAPQHGFALSSANNGGGGRTNRLAQDDSRSRHAPGYSRFVSAMKLLLPMVALLLIILVVAWPYLKTQSNRFRLGFVSMGGLGGAEDPAMLNPRYMGTDSNSQPYSVTADIAKNLLKANSAVQLEMPKADISLKDGSWLVMTAETGVYARNNKILDLAGRVNLFHDSGYEFSTEKARVDLNEGIAYGEVPVEGQGPFGDLKAEGFRLIGKNKTIFFTGKAKLIIYPSAGRPPVEGD